MSTTRLQNERNLDRTLASVTVYGYRYAFRLAFCVAICSLFIGTANAQRLTGVPDDAKAVRVDEMLGDSISLDQTFFDSNGEPTTLRKINEGRLPTLLTFNYSDCPGLCVAQLNGLSEAINEVDRIGLGKDFKLVSISIDPTETQDKLKAFRARYTSHLPKQHDAEGWKFLRGSQRDIQSLADATGFRYTYDAKHNRYSHGSVAIAISPSGKITRYLFEVGYKPETIRMSLVEASEGRIGTTADQILLACFHYNSEEGRYSADAKRILSYVAGAFVIIGLAASAPFWISARRQSSNNLNSNANNNQSTDNEVGLNSDSSNQS